MASRKDQYFDKLQELFEITSKREIVVALCNYFSLDELKEFTEWMEEQV